MKMDRRNKDYFLITFKQKRDPYSWGSGYQTQEFSKLYFKYIDLFVTYPTHIKVHWKCINSIPYVLVSVPKPLSNIAVGVFRTISGVKNVLPYTKSKEKDFDMWNKILRIPYYHLDMKYRVRHCMQKDLFIDWQV